MLLALLVASRSGPPGGPPGGPTGRSICSS